MLKLLQKDALAMLILLCLPMGAFASNDETKTFGYDGIVYYTNGGGVCSVYGNENKTCSGDIVIPELVYDEDGGMYSVKSIGAMTFADNKNITSVKIASTVQEIGWEAFRGCENLTAVTFDGESVLTSIGSSAFRGCSSLQSIVLPSSLESIDNEAFRECVGLVSIAIPQNVTALELSLFYGCSSLASVTLPSGLTSIAPQAFCGCSSLGAIEIPESVEEITNNLFYGCEGLETVTFLGNKVKSIGNCAFDGCGSLESIAIPNSVESIGSWAFAGCSSLETVTFGSSLTSIGDYGFRDCDIKTLNLPGKLESVGNEAFALNSALESVTIPASLTYMGVNPFSRCDYLQDIQPEEGGEFLFVDGCLCSKSGKLIAGTCRAEIVVPDFVSSIGDYAFYLLNSTTVINKISIPKSVKSIGSSAFRGKMDIYLYGVLDECNNSFNLFSGKLHTFASSQSDISSNSNYWDGTFVTFTESIDIKEFGIATFCPEYGLDLTGNSEISAYKASMNGGKILLTKVDAVAPGEGALLRSMNGGALEKVIDSEYVDEPNPDNAFVGTLSDIVVPSTDGGYTNYVLGKKDDVAGFYIANNTKVGAGKAYLPIKTVNGSAARGFVISFDDDEATGIVEAISGESISAEGWFDLGGRKVSELKSGVYMRDGKKVYIIK